MDFSHDFDSTLSFESAALRSLSPQQKERLTEVLDTYLRALEEGTPQRAEQLLEAHPDLARPLAVYLDSLAQLHDVAAGFGNASMGPVAEGGAVRSDERRLGDFVLLREIGRGGMGVVYEARQLSLGRRVALKVLPFAAVLDSRQIARFKNEAQAAAGLQHPNIVPVYAVGSDRGVHYYAMQFIDGQPLDRVIAELRAKSNGSADAQSLPSAEDTEGFRGSGGHATPPPHCQSSLAKSHSRRQEYFQAVIRLGIQAAEALHAAHSYGVVHRDVKPSNLLLDGEGKLWVTDFGLARCQSDLTLTRTGAIVGTRRYMSPEQALGESALLDQRSDLYSLGATLYELLTLRAAFPGDNEPEFMRYIEREEPTPPRHLEPLIPVDLETVVLTAMASQRDDRYATAQEFADDLRRVLEGKPIVARPPTLADRVGKWARRHSRIVAAAAAVGLCAMIGLGTATLLITHEKSKVTREKSKAETNYRRAEEHFRQAQDAVDRLGARLAERLAQVPGAEQVRRDLLQETLRYYQDFLRQAKKDPALRSDLATTYSKIGTLSNEIGSTDDAIAAHESALRLFEELAAEKPDVPDYRRHVAVSKNNLALLFSRSGRTDEARRVYDEAIRLQNELVAEQPQVVQYQIDLGLWYNNLGELQSETGAAGDAEKSFREAVRLQEKLASDHAENAELLRNLAASYNNLAGIYADSDRPAQAIELYEKTADYRIKAAQIRPGELQYQSDLALTFNNLGALQSKSQEPRKAALSYGRAIELRQGLLRAAPLHRSYRRDLAISYNNLGQVQNKLKHSAEAERSFHSALELQESLVAQSPHDLDICSGLGGIHNNLGIVQEELHRPEDAAQSYKKAIFYQQTAHRGAPAVDRYRSFLSNHLINYARVLRELGRVDEAARATLERKDLWPGDPQRQFSAAEELALDSKLLARQPQGGDPAERCANWALDTLQAAVAAGFKLPADLARNESFAALRGRPQFMKLIQQ